MKKPYEEAYKLVIVLMVEELRLPLIQVAKSQGISANILHRWITKFREEGVTAFGVNKHRLNTVNADTRKLKSQIKELHKENRVLKQTLHLLTKE
ncbi:transposase [Paenibacillaceae sp. P-4]|uniref:transposase n=1 Tax=Paenibacillaceae bacterium P-4 TaxID=3160969 RepID=UPI0032E82321